MHKGKFKKFWLKQNERSFWHTENYIQAKKSVKDVH